MPAASYRFLPGGGARLFYAPLDQQFVYASSPTPGAASPRTLFAKVFADDGLGMDVTANRQPRVYATLASGATVFDTCSYLCDLLSGWQVNALTPAASFAVAALVGVLPAALYWRSGDTTLHVRMPVP